MAMNDEPLASPWRENLSHILADSLLNADQSRSIENRFSQLSDLAVLFEELGNVDESDADEVRGSVEDINLAARTMLSLNADIEREVSTWALLIGSRPLDSERRIQALGLTDFASVPTEWSELPRQWGSFVEWHRSAAPRLRRLIHAVLSVESLDDVVILMALVDGELARVVYVSTYALVGL